MKLSKQTLLGTGVLLGGSVLLYATLHQVKSADQNSQTADNAVASAVVSTNPASTATNDPLTADIRTEQAILAQKQKEREARVEGQEQAAEQYLTEQQQIEAEALARSRAENQLYIHRNASTATPIVQPVVKPRPVNDTVATVTEDNTLNNSIATNNETDIETSSHSHPTVATVITPRYTQQKSAEAKSTKTTETKSTQTKPTENKFIAKNDVKTAEKTQTKAQNDNKQTTRSPTFSGSYQVRRGDGLIALSKRYNVPVSAIAAANGIERNTPLRVGQRITIPSASEVQRLQQEVAQRERERQQEVARKQQQATEQKQQKQAYQAAQQKLKEARKEVKETDAKGSFGVQVALATDQAKANEIAKKLQAAGYKVKTSQTSRGVRVVVGPETGKVAALALKDKVNSDPRSGVNNAWVLYW